MCTVLILSRPGHDWPVLIAGNRDELVNRPASPPDRHWSDRPDVVAGLDQLGGGSWMGINDYGTIAIMLNRTGSLGPMDGKRSRGELTLEALDHADAATAAAALKDLNGTAYRPFNMLIADNTALYWVKSLGDSRPQIFPIAPGYHMLTAYDLDDTASSRIQFNLPMLQNADVPDPQAGNWVEWIDVLTHGKGMSFLLPNGFGTVSSSLMALPSKERADLKPVWLYSNAPPGEAPFTPVL